MLGESEGTTGAATIEQVGRRRSFTRTTITAAVLLLVQQPMTDAVRDGTGCEIPGRLSLLVDGLFITAYLLAAYRGFKYVRCLRQPKWTRVALAGSTVLAVAAVLDAIEDVVLWGKLDDPGSCYGLTAGGFSWLMRAVWVAGVVLLAAAVLLTSRLVRGRSEEPETSFRPVEEDGFDNGRLVICCSGGGIRSASFCLGALQMLDAKGIYGRASSVIGVSGGGYMASAFHVMRGKITDGPGPYASGSPELARLRRQTRYLLQGPQAKFRAALSVLFGVSVNLLLIGITLRSLAWVLGWFLADQKVLRPDPSSPGQLLVDWRPDGSSVYLGLSTVTLLAGIAFFALEKIADRFGRLPDFARTFVRMAGGKLLTYGMAVAALLLGVPAGLDLLNRLVRGTRLASAADQPTLPRVLLDLVDPSKSGIASFVALVIALIGLGRVVWTGLSVEGKDRAESPLRRRALGFLRGKVAPWLGTVIIGVAAVIVLLRWTGGYATDPSYRSSWGVAALMAGIAVGVKFLTDANRTSLHPFYRERLQTAYLVERDPVTGAAKSLDYSLPLYYSQYARATGAGPQLIVGAVANVTDADFVPTDRDCVPFIFDPARIGIVGDTSLPQGGLVETSRYELEADYQRREVTVPAAMAISGAAFSPLTGRANARSRPVRLLLALLNARLGVWLPNPYWNNPPVNPSWYEPPTGLWSRAHHYVRSLSDKPGAYRLLREAVGSPSLYDRRIYVTDGGHYDNLGLVEALRRRPAQIIVIDASGDPEDRFSTLGEAIATARMDHGILIDLDPSPMKRESRPRTDRAWVDGTATHPLRPGEQEPLKTDIFYLKALLVEDLGWDVETYAAGHADFPRHTTVDQFYGEWDFEAYRALGQTLAATMLDRHNISDRLTNI